MKKLLLTTVAILALTFGIGFETVRAATPAYSVAPSNPDNSIATLSTGQQSVSGLTNVLSLACGIPINDGSTHTVGTAPAGSCFNGKTTLAQLAAIVINGTTPFSFLTASGATVGPLCSYQSTTNCFTNGAYNLTDSSVANMDIGWLAIQAALVTKKVYIPSGTYIIGSSYALPLMIPTNLDDALGDNQSIEIKGDGDQTSVIKAGSSFGTLADGNTVIPLLGCGDPGATPVNSLGRWGGGTPAAGQCKGVIEQIGILGDIGATGSATSTYRTDGLALAARLFTRFVSVKGFWRDVTFQGDHTMHYRLNASGGVHGFYWESPNTFLVGDNHFIGLTVAGQAFDSFEVDGNAAVQGIFEGETYFGANYYTVYGEPNGCQSMVYDATFTHLMTEYGDLAVFEDGHNYTGTNASGTYNDANKCRNISDITIRNWFQYFGNTTTAVSGGRRRRALIDVSAISGELNGLDTNGGNFMPIADNVGAAGIAMINVNLIGTNTAFHMSGQIGNIFLLGVGAGISGATIPVFNATAHGGPAGLPGFGAYWEDPGQSKGVFRLLQTQGNYTATSVGDVMEQDATNPHQVVPGGFTTTQPTVGVAAQDGLTNGMMVPIQIEGEQYVSTGYHSVNNGLVTRSTGIGGHTTFVGGSGGTNGTYTVTASAGCSTEPQFTVTVAGGTITGVASASTEAPTGCTAIPTVSNANIVAAGAIGLTGASITPQWPSADMASVNLGSITAAQIPLIFGQGFANAFHGSSGSFAVYTHLINLH